MKINLNKILLVICLINLSYLLIFATDKKVTKKETVCFMCKSYSAVNLINTYSKLGYSVKCVVSESVAITAYHSYSESRGGFLIVMEK